MDEKFKQRYNNLNQRQQDAVEAIDGPVAVIAGPGTGKTELVSMRIANILRKTDTSPENILCLTFTDSGALAMRQRLLEIIGPNAHKINIYTFHSFGSTVMSQNINTFFGGAPFRPADPLTTHQILTEIFDELPHDDPLIAKRMGEYTNINKVKGAISNIKKGGLSSEELELIITTNEIDIKNAEDILQPVVAARVGKNSIDTYSQAVLEINKLDRTPLPNDTPSILDVIQKSLLRAISQAETSGKNTPISDWKSEWMERDSKKNYVFKSNKRHTELRAIKNVYEKYIDRMTKEQLYDYDDMILMTLAALKTNKELLYNLQEQYQYVLIDEFQDTNQAQMQIVYRLLDNSVNEDKPNVLIVGDDDQAIYGFQGADSSNITTFLDKYPTVKLINLIDNYRSSQKILDQSRSIITQGVDRLENTTEQLNKELNAHLKASDTHAHINIYEDMGSERQGVAQKIHDLIKNGEDPGNIAVLARKHDHLVDLLPFLDEKQVPVSYEKHDNALDLDSIKQLELMTRFFLALKTQDLELANSYMPELISHPMWDLDPEVIWQISVRAYKERVFWLDTLNTVPETIPVYRWLVNTNKFIHSFPLETAIDHLSGKHKLEGDSEKTVVSPFYKYYFSEEVLAKEPQKYLYHLNALAAIRSKLREYLAEETGTTLKEFIEFLDLNRTLKEPIPISQNISTVQNHSVQLMTAHKAKGLEFKHVFIINASDNNWGSSSRSGNSGYKFPENLQLAPAGDTLDERIRLFYVAATRAKQTLNISHSKLNDKGKATLLAGFLEGDNWTINQFDQSTSITELTKQAEISWSARVSVPNQNLKELLHDRLTKYTLNSTALSNFIDLQNGGPQYFLTQNLLHFPQAPSTSSSFGTAVHDALQQAHLHFNRFGQNKPIEDVVTNFESNLRKNDIEPAELDKLLIRGSDALQIFLEEKNPTFNANQQAEVNFNNQNAVFEDIPLTGKMDVFEVDKEQKQLTITDYKTGKPSENWKGKSDFQKVKLHKYKIQLMFYRLLVEQSRDYYNYTLKDSILSFVEPDNSNKIHTLSAEFTDAEYDHFKELVKAVYNHITTLNLPDVSEYEPNLKGIIQFEQDLIDGNTVEKTN